MAILTVFRIEWRRIWRNKLTRAGMIVGLIIPLLYSFLYLWAFWNPYGSLSQLPVAIVNADTGGTLNGKHVDYGHTLANNLLQDKQLGWKVVSLDTADTGVENGKYFAALKIPQNFTKDVLSVSGTHPHKAQITLVPNQGSNYLAGKIISRVQNDVAASLNQQFSQQFLSRLLGVIGKESTGLSTAAKQAGQLAVGSKSVHSGAKQVAGGIDAADTGAHRLAVALTQLSPGSQHLTTGLSATAKGTQKLDSGINQTRQGVSEIHSKLASAATGAKNLAAGLQQADKSGTSMRQASGQLLAGSKQAEQGAAALTGGLQQAESASNQIQKGVGGTLQILAQSPVKQNPAVQQAVAALQQLYPGTQKLTGSLTQLQSGSSKLNSSLQKLHSGQEQLTGGLAKLSTRLGSAAAGAGQIATGIGTADQGLAQIQSALSQSGAALDKLAAAQKQLYTGSRKISSGVTQAKTGAESLATGLDQANHGTNTLVKGSNQVSVGASAFAKKLNALPLSAVTNQTEKAKLMSNPVTIRSLAINPVTKYGPGLTPYFLPLSLWVGALMLYFILSLREGRWRMAPVSGTSVLLGKFAVLWSIGVIQAIIAASALLLGLGLTVTNTLGFYLYSIVLAITYITVIGMLINVLGTGPGRVLAIVLLLLQLTSSGGTFPIQLVPRFFQAVHPWLPMSYAATGLRRLIAFHNLTGAWHTAAIAGLYFLGSFAILALNSLRRIKPVDLKVPDHLVS